MYLVTGGCGFIGSHLVDALVAQGRRVKVLDNLSTGSVHNIRHHGNQIEFIQGDIRDEQVVRQAMSGVQHVFHQAALVSVSESVRHPQHNHDVNITGTLNVLVSSRDAGVKRVLLASSAAIYGDGAEHPKHEDLRPQPTSPYGVAKLTKEHYQSVFSSLYGLETVSLRYFNVYGPRQDPSSMYSGVISRFSQIIQNGGTPTLFGDGKQTRDFVYVEDVVRANLAAMGALGLGGGEVFNIATGRSTSLLQLLEFFRDITGRQFEPKLAPAREGDIRHSVATIDRATEQLGYRPQFSMRQGLTRLMSLTSADRDERNRRLPSALRGQ